LEISPRVSINFLSEVPGVLWAKWFHITSTFIENEYVFVLGDPGHHPEAKKSDCVADMNAFGLGWDWTFKFGPCQIETPNTNFN
jgi:hypothetical protein